MLVRLAFGSRVGEVVDFPPHEALAMLSDGRGSRPDDGTPSLPERPSRPVDRGLPKGKREARR